MPIAPDTKDWTWVLERECEECGFDATAVSLESVPQRLVEIASTWRAHLAGVDRAVLARRPSDDRWSVLEYACHIRDVYRVAHYRVSLMLTKDNPTFPNWDQDASALEDHYDERDPAEVAEEIGESAQRAAQLFESLPPGGADRSGVRSDGPRFTVASFGRYVIHDLVHHLADVR